MFLYVICLFQDLFNHHHLLAKMQASHLVYQSCLLSIPTSWHVTLGRHQYWHHPYSWSKVQASASTVISYSTSTRTTWYIKRNTVLEEPATRAETVNRRIRAGKTWTFRTKKKVVRFVENNICFGQMWDFYFAFC